MNDIVVEACLLDYRISNLERCYDRLCADMRQIKWLLVVMAVQAGGIGCVMLT